MKQEVHVALTGNELIVREGKAPEIYPPRLVRIEGDVYAPAEYFTKRWESEIEKVKDTTHLLVDRENLHLKLTIGEKEHFSVEVDGRLEFFEEFSDFGINEEKKYTVSSLYKMLRLKRAFFKNREEHAAILDQLKKFEAKTEVEFKSTNDFKGSTALQKIQNCKTNITYSFMLHMPIYKGMPASTFPVEIEFEPHDGGIICWLISEDVAELEVVLRDEVINQQVRKFDQVVIIQK